MWFPYFHVFFCRGARHGIFHGIWSSETNYPPVVKHSWKIFAFSSNFILYWLVVWNIWIIFSIQLGMLSSQLTNSYFSEGKVYHQVVYQLVGGFKHFFFHNIWDNPSHWLSYFSRWLKPPARSSISISAYHLVIFCIHYISVTRVIWPKQCSACRAMFFRELKGEGCGKSTCWSMIWWSKS